MGVAGDKKIMRDLLERVLNGDEKKRESQKDEVRKREKKEKTKKKCDKERTRPVTRLE